MRVHHFFDWDAFIFSAKTIAFLFVVGAGGYYVLQYAAGAEARSAPSLVLIQEARPAAGKSLVLSTTTSAHIINTLTVADAVPRVGKLIAVDLRAMVLTLYEDGAAIRKYPILAKGENGSPQETPAGFYTVLAKESDHLNTREHIDLPWSVQFYGNHFIHGWPYAANGSLVDASSAGGGIRLHTEDAALVYAFADPGTGIFLYSPRTPLASLTLDAIPAPLVSAESYLVADIDTGDVFLEKDAGDLFPLASVTKLVTALVANQTIPFDTKITVPRNPILATNKEESFFAGDLLYPLLMQSDNIVAERLAQAYGTERFVDWMNAAAKALDMQSTRFAEATGTTTLNVSTANDLFHLAAYLADGKSLILEVARTPAKDLIAASGKVYPVSAASATRNTMLSVSLLPLNNTERRVAIIVLGSKDAAADTAMLSDWFAQSALQGADLAGTACITCAIIPPYRKIQR